MGGGGSIGSQNIQLVPFSQLKQGIGNLENFGVNQFNNLVNNNPLLNKASAAAQQFYGGLGQLTSPLMTQLQQVPGQYNNLIGQVGNIAGQVPGQFSGIESGIQGVANTLN